MQANIPAVSSCVNSHVMSGGQHFAVPPPPRFTSSFILVSSLSIFPALEEWELIHIFHLWPSALSYLFSVF